MLPLQLRPLFCSALSLLRLRIPQIKQLHAQLVVSAAISDPHTAGKLVAFAAISDHGDLQYARLLVDHLPNVSLFMWNTTMRAYVDRRHPLDAVCLYRQMNRASFVPNNYTFSFVLRACVDLSSLVHGRVFHGVIVRLGWEGYDFVQNGLIHMYAHCGCVASARKLFDESSSRDVVSWTAMVNGYAKIGEIGDARALFDRMPERNEVSWSAIINMYAQFGRFEEALEVFGDMQAAGVWPNHSSIVSALSACGSLGALEQGRWIHTFVERNQMKLDRILGTALVDMYAKCGCIDMAKKVFFLMSDRDVYAYTAMITSLSNHGESGAAVELFDRMGDGVMPNGVTFISVLSACGRAGLVDRGRQIFHSMDSNYKIKPGVEHYGCFVDLLSRVGLLEEAKKVVQEMPMKPDNYVLGALLNACGMHGEMDLGKKTVESLKEMDLDDSGVHVLMSNMYASADRWEDVSEARKVMVDNKVLKIPGCSKVEVNGVVCEFVAGDRSHTQINEIILAVKGVDDILKSLNEDATFAVCEESSY